MRIRVTTKAHLFEQRKQQHIERGYRIEDERPIPVNGLCSFVAVREYLLQIRLANSSLRRSMENTVHTVIVEVCDVTQNPLSF
jgi:hypothetical protein